MIQLVFGGSQVHILGSRCDAFRYERVRRDSDVGYLVGGAGLLDMNFVAVPYREKDDESHECYPACCGSEAQKAVSRND